VEFHYATMWEALADALGDATALVQGEVRRSWRDFDARAASLAGAFTEAGLGPGSKVGLFLYNAPEFMESYFAALKIRAVPFNVNYRYVEKELLYLLDNADAEALVFHSSFGETVAGILTNLPGLKLAISVDDGGPQLEATESYQALMAHEPAPRITRSPDDVTMIYTGGTTGMPKGVVSKIGSTVQDLLTTTPAMIGEQPAPTPEDAIAIAVRFWAEGRQFVTIPAPPLIHNTALGIGANPTLLFGGRVVLLNGRRFDVDELWDVAAREHANCLVVVGDAFARPMLKALEEPGAPERDLSSLSLIASSGAMFSSEVKVGLHEHLPRAVVADIIAATEGAMGLSISMKTHPAPTGTFTPWPGVVLVGEEGQILRAGSDEVGMVALPGGAEGYFKDEEKTAATFRVIDGVRYTLPGDFATIGPDGTLTLLGRGSQCINTAGEKVFPEEVEEVMKLHPAVEDCLVFGQPDERFGQRVVAVVSLAGSGSSVADEELLARAKEHLASYKLPRQIVTVDAVPRTATGKADYPEARLLFDAAVANANANANAPAD
jgi:acyl-CoA synthetase (AMP-forming)/AMP-acid ligase II